jgi:hypothetical protein
MHGFKAAQRGVGTFREHIQEEQEGARANAHTQRGVSIGKEQLRQQRQKRWLTEEEV